MVFGGHGASKFCFCFSFPNFLLNLWFQELKETSVDDLAQPTRQDEGSSPATVKAPGLLRLPSTPAPGPPSLTRDDLSLEDVVNV
jgi:hypothetical protein